MTTFSRDDVVAVGRSYFTPPARPDTITLGDGREVWFGYYQSVRPSQGWKLVINVDGKMIHSQCSYTEILIFSLLLLSR